MTDDKQELLDLIDKYIERVEIVHNYLNKFFNFDVPEDVNEELKDKVHDINKIKLNEKEKAIKEYIEEVKNSINSSWAEYNDNYKNYLGMMIHNSLKTVEGINIIDVNNNNFKYNIWSMIEHYKSFMTINTTIDDVITKFSKSNSNYVIFGKNGSGKTKMLNYIKNALFNTNAYVMPANRNIDFEKENNVSVNCKNVVDLRNLFNESNPFGSCPNNILTLMIKEKDYEDLQSNRMVNGEINIGNTLNDFMNIFNELSIERKIKLKENILLLYNDNIPEYNVCDASDGEKSIIQFILFVLLCPLNSFIFIDEPETHLNGALLCELFSCLEQKRKDIRFIYCTHNIDFIESRENSKLIFSKKYNNDKWETEEIDSYEDIPLKVIADIIGTKKDILFIEGDYKSLDYKLYSSLFPQFKIIPISSCQKVIENCRAKNLFNRNYYGIVDNDYRSKKEIKKLNKSNIDVLKYNEVENLLLSPLILDKVLSSIDQDSKTLIIKEKIINKAENSKQGIIQDYINKVYSKVQSKPHFQYTDLGQLKIEIDKSAMDNRDKFLNELPSFINQVDNIFANKDYANLIMLLSNKGLLSRDCIEMSIDNYVSIVKNIIETDEEFKEKIISDNFTILKSNI